MWLNLTFLLSFFAVKPDPPESVMVKELEGYSKRLIVSWNFPSSWPLHDAFPLVFHIRYRPLGSMYWSEVSKQGWRLHFTVDGGPVSSNWYCYMKKKHNKNVKKTQRFHFPFQAKSGTRQMSGHSISVFFSMFSLTFCLVCHPERTPKPKTVRNVGSAVPQSCLLIWTFFTSTCDAAVTTAASRPFHCGFLVLTFPCPVSFSIDQIYSEESPVVISDALAGHVHQVQVRARDEVNSESQWSEWSPLLLVRPWEGLKENTWNVHF